MKTWNETIKWQLFECSVTAVKLTTKVGPSGKTNKRFCEKSNPLAFPHQVCSSTHQTCKTYTEQFVLKVSLQRSTTTKLHNSKLKEYEKVTPSNQIFLKAHVPRAVSPTTSPSSIVTQRIQKNSKGINSQILPWLCAEVRWRWKSWWWRRSCFDKLHRLQFYQ